MWLANLSANDNNSSTVSLLLLGFLILEKRSRKLLKECEIQTTVALSYILYNNPFEQFLLPEDIPVRGFSFCLHLSAIDREKAEGYTS